MRNENLNSQTFDFYSLRFEFSALDEFIFPPLLSANIFRGAFGLALRRTSPAAYEQCFASVLDSSAPSGLTHPPRPLVFRTRPLDGKTIQPSEAFSINLNFLHSSSELIPKFTDAFRQMGRLGFGPQRSRANLLEQSSDLRKCSLSLAPVKNAEKIRVEFLTPTELKSNSALLDRPQFEILLGRARDRISTLRTLYGPGPLLIDFEVLSKRASEVQLTLNRTQHVQASRRSSRTGQTHPLGGFVGAAEYVGPLSEFLPYLEIAAHTGVGRQTVWGKGEIATHILA